MHSRASPEVALQKPSIRSPVAQRHCAGVNAPIRPCISRTERCGCWSSTIWRTDDALPGNKLSQPAIHLVTAPLRLQLAVQQSDWAHGMLYGRDDATPA